MDYQKYKTLDPQIYEESIERCTQLLDMINNYNESLLSSKDLPYTDEEISALQEEYEILNDYIIKYRRKMQKSYSLTKEAENNLLDEVKPKSFIDSLHPVTMLYCFFSTILLLGFLNKPLGRAFTNLFSKIIYNRAYKELDIEIILNYSPIGYTIILLIAFLLIPLVIIISTIIISNIFKNKNDRKVYIYSLGIQVFCTIIVTTILIFTTIIPAVQSLVNSPKSSELLQNYLKWLYNVDQTYWNELYYYLR